VYRYVYVYATTRFQKICFLLFDAILSRSSLYFEEQRWGEGVRVPVGRLKAFHHCHCRDLQSVSQSHCLDCRCQMRMNDSGLIRDSNLSRVPVDYRVGSERSSDVGCMYEYELKTTVVLCTDCCTCRPSPTPRAVHVLVPADRGLFSAAICTPRFYVQVPVPVPVAKYVGVPGTPTSYRYRQLLVSTE
jgi:hypothetical protein